MGPPGVSTVYGSAHNAGPTTISINPTNGTAVPLPDQQNLTGITANGVNTEFTVSETGTYLLSYTVNLGTAMAAGSRLMLNGVPHLTSVIPPTLQRSSFTFAGVVNLTPGDTIRLDLFGASAVLNLVTGNGASLTIVKLGD